MSYRIEDFVRLDERSNYAFGVCPEKSAQALRRLAIDLVDETGPKTLLSGVTVVNKITVDNFASTTIILRLFVPRELP